jgi:hypothetical protein
MQDIEHTHRQDSNPRKHDQGGITGLLARPIYTTAAQGIKNMELQICACRYSDTLDMHHDTRAVLHTHCTPTMHLQPVKGTRAPAPAQKTEVSRGRCMTRSRRI